MKNNTIKLLGTGRKIELVAKVALSPGTALQIGSDGKAIKHATDGSPRGWTGIVALEDALQGRTKNDAYAINNRINAFAFQAGDRLQMLLAPSPASTARSAITVGTEVSLNGAGQIEALADGPNGKKPIGFAIEAVAAVADSVTTITPSELVGIQLY